MIQNITVRWLIIYWALGAAASPLIFDRPVDITHFIWAFVALVLIYFAPKPEVKEK